MKAKVKIFNFGGMLHSDNAAVKFKHQPRIGEQIRMHWKKSPVAQPEEVHIEVTMVEYDLINNHVIITCKFV